MLLFAKSVNEHIFANWEQALWTPIWRIEEKICFFVFVIGHKKQFHVVILPRTSEKRIEALF